MLLSFGVFGQSRQNAPGLSSFDSPNESSPSILSGLESPLGKICRSFQFNGPRTECARLVRNGNFDPLAIDLCAAEKFDSEKLDCLAGIKSVHYDASASKICLSLTEQADRRQCFAVIGNKDFGPESLAQCESKGLPSHRIHCLAGVARPLKTPRDATLQAE